MKFTSTLALSAVAALAFGLHATASKAETVLRYSNFLPAGYVVFKDIQKPWMDAVTEATNGSVKFDVSPKVIGTVSGQYDVVVDGLADVSFVVPGYSPGRFQLADGLEANFLGEDSTKRCPATWEMYKKYYEPIGFMGDVQVLGFYCTSPGQFIGKNALTSMEDFKNLKIRVGNAAMIEAMETLGALPVNKPASELYEMASGGIIDSAIFPLDTIVGFKLDEVWKQVTMVPGAMSVTPVAVVMNKGVWDKLSEDEQKAIMSVSGRALAERAGAALTASTEAAIESLKAGGATFTTMDEAVVKQIEEKFQPVLQKWIDYAKANGMEDPEGMLADLKAASN